MKVKAYTKHTERIHFRLISMPCCGHQLCWVNPRLPTYCPECGKISIMALRETKEAILVSDFNAMLITYTEDSTETQHG